jgi:hypothetical protein
MRLTLAFLIASAIAFAQTTPAPAPASTSSAPSTAAAATAAALNSITLPAYVAGGAAYNQFAGANLWGSAVIPFSQSLGLYESTTADVFPVKTVINGKSGYVFTTSVREGVHRVIHQDSKNMLLLGADAGFSFSQASAAGSATSGISGAVTATYVRQLTASLAFMVPVRMLYVSSLGGWNPIVEMGIVWKPGASK